MPLPAKNIKKPDEKQMQYRDGNGGQKSVQIDKEKQIASVHPFLVQSGLAAARSKPPDQSITSQMIDIEIVALKNLFKDADSINGQTALGMNSTLEIKGAKAKIYMTMHSRDYELQKTLEEIPVPNKQKHQ